MSNDFLFVGLLIFALFLPLVAYRFGKTWMYAFVAINACALFPLAPLSANVFGFAVSLTTVYYASLFLTTDLLNERYGRKAAYLAVATNIITSYLITFMIQFALMFEPAPGSIEFKEVIGQTYQHSWRMLIMGTLCFGLTQIIDVSVFHYIKKWTKGKMLWLRNNISSISSGLFGNLFFWYFAFGNTIDNWFATAMAGFFLTTFVIICDTPFVYLAKLITPSDQKK